MLGKNLIKAAAGNAGGGDVLGIEDVFSTWLYTGNGSTQTITNGIDLDGEGGMVWLKRRNSTNDHYINSSARPYYQFTKSNSTDAEFTSFSTLSSLNSDGFTLGNNSVTNASGGSYVSWTMRKAPKFFDTIFYTGTGVARTVAHDLGSVPGVIIVKRVDSTGNWIVYHRSLGATKNLLLESTNAENTSSANWNNTAPTSSVFTVGTGTLVNASGGNYVAYLFAHDAGGFGDDGTESVIKCGSNSHTSGTWADVTLGWEPQFVLMKNATATTGSGWWILDNMRGAVTGGNDAIVYANLTNSEDSGSDYVEFTPTGFRYQIGQMGTNNTVVYIAIRRGPMKTPEDATTVLALETVTPSAGQTFTTGFPVDATFSGYRANASNKFIVQDRLRGYAKTNTTGNYSALLTSSSADETNYYASNPWLFASDSNVSIKYGSQIASINNVAYAFRRAPGFFDVVAYTGTGSARTVSHNLGVAPELMIVKRRDATANWQVYHGGLTSAAYKVNLDTTGAESVLDNWNSTDPTSTVFSLGTTTGVNGSGGTYIAYLFATCPGVSKVGSYTGTGTTLNVDCGFTSGARFVLIKRTDSTGDWYVWDTARGIVSGNDPYLLLNSTAAEVTSTDYIDPLSSGFQISSSAPTAINASGGSFIFLAIA